MIKTSSILISLGVIVILFLVMGVFSNAVFIGNIGGEEGITITAMNVSDKTIIILFSISILAILIGLVIKLSFEMNYGKRKKR